MQTLNGLAFHVAHKRYDRRSVAVNHFRRIGRRRPLHGVDDDLLNLRLVVDRERLVAGRK